MTVEEESLFFLIFEAKESNYASCELSFICVLFFFFSETFFLMLVNLVYYLELLYFKLEAVFFEGGLWCYFDLLELWSAFPSLRVTEGTIQNCVQRTSK